MKLKYKKTEKAFNQSFSVQRQIKPHLDANWHFHEEYELIYIIKGSGIRIVCDNISDFRPGQLVLIGPWMPHLWKNEGSEDEHVNAVIIKFNKQFHGQDFFFHT
jgi:quercetin dioxygenase-like cupin family protein